MRTWGLLLLVLMSGPLFAQVPGAPNVADPPSGPVPSPTATLTGQAPTPVQPVARTPNEPEPILGRSVRAGQQHWISLNASILQPTAARLGVKVWERFNGSLWLEVSGGSVLVEPMLGFGVRAQYSIRDLGPGDTLMLAPGIGAQLIPNHLYEYPGQRWSYSSGRYVSFSDEKRNDLWFLTADADISWLHDFSPRFGMELGVKLGLGFHVGGKVGINFPRELTYGKHVYPVFAVFSGMRF